MAAHLTNIRAEPLVTLGRTEVPRDSVERTGLLPAVTGTESLLGLGEGGRRSILGEKK
jgi:hypothetical protein